MRLLHARTERDTGPPFAWPTLLLAGTILLALVAAQLASGQTAAGESARSAVREAAALQRETARRQRSTTATAMQQAIARQRAAAIRVSTPTLNTSFRSSRPWSNSSLAGSSFAWVPCEPLSLEEVNPVVERASAVEGVDPNLVRAVIAQESGFRPCAVSPKGAVGLMQLMPAVIEELDIQDALDPAQNIGAGTRLLRRLLDRYNGDLALALAAYNAGPARVDKANGIPQISETMQYVSELLKKMLIQRAPAPDAPRPR